jgi:hypothetical protein
LNTPYLPSKGPVKTMHNVMKKIAVILCGSFAVLEFAPNLAQAQYVQDSLTVAPSVEQKYQRYLQLTEPLAFAISVDGKLSSGSFCQQPGTCANINGPQVALDQCNAASTPDAPCKLFAIGRDIIWYGRISLKPDVGSGPLTLAPAVEQKFQKYNDLAEPLAFAVSLDGQRASGSFCQSPGTCQDIDGPGLALERCQVSGGPQDLPCKLFAIGRDIVWDGPVTLSENQPQTVLVPPPSAAPNVSVSAPTTLPQPPLTNPVANVTPAAPEPTPSTPERVRSSKAFKDLEEEIRKSQQAVPVGQ